MKQFIFALLLAFSLLIAACGRTPAPEITQTPAATSTPDLCSSENLPGAAAKVNKLMREFDDYSSLASNTPQSQLVVIIPEMQRILREAEDQTLPACMQNLKGMQLAHMQIVIQTLMAFMSSSDVNLVNAGISQARELHGQYDIELARLLGITLVPRPTQAPAGATPQSNELPPSAALVTNPGPNSVNLRSAPGLDAPEAAVLAASASTVALGRSADDQWIMVEIPGQPGQAAWLYSTLVQLSVPIAQLPIVNP